MGGPERKEIVKPVELHTTCPYCNTAHDCVTDFETENLPSSGEIHICGTCARPAFFTEDLGLRKIREEEWWALPNELKEAIIQGSLEIHAGIQLRKMREAMNN